MGKCQVEPGRAGDVAFYAWLRRHRRCDSAIGDLARDAMKCHWPAKYRAGAGAWHRKLTEYGACPQALEALDRALNFWDLRLTYCRFD